jgi:signal transduction histidine kinase
VNLIKLLNSSNDDKVEVALYKLAQLNSLAEIAAPIFVPLAIAWGFYATLDHTKLTIWLLLMASSAITALISYRALNPRVATAEPSAAQVQIWRRANLLALLAAGIGWGNLGLLLDATHADQNAVILMSYLGVMSAGGNASGAHSFRLYFVVVGLSLLEMWWYLPIGFGSHAAPIGVLMLLYTLFVAKVSSNTQATIMRTVELQLINEQLLHEKSLATQAEQRERIYHDLHDDVGAKLLGIALSAQMDNRPREADVARAALQDLRDVVSRSAQSNTLLSDLLADLCAETEQRIQSAKIELVWHFCEHEIALPMSAGAALQVSRIVREAISNVLRHAEARNIVVTPTINAQNFMLTIVDDGKGCPSSGLKQHRGMSGMSSRAEKLQASLTWNAVEPHGCCVKLSVPLASLPPPPNTGLTKLDNSLLSLP